MGGEVGYGDPGTIGEWMLTGERRWRGGLMTDKSLLMPQAQGYINDYGFYYYYYYYKCR